jgi:hypothetical protein
MRGWFHSKLWGNEDDRLVMTTSDDQVLNWKIRNRKTKPKVEVKAKVLLRALVLVIKTP